MADQALNEVERTASAPRPDRRLQALYLLLGFSAGLPFPLFSTVLTLRLQAAEIGLVVIGFFAWVQLLPTVKFLWAPLVDRYDIPGFSRFWGRRRSWMMLAQLGTVTSLLAMALIDPRENLALIALFALLLAFWTTTLEVAADAWRIELAPNKEQQAPLAAANLWGYRTAFVVAGSGALLIADLPGWGWTGAYLAIALAAFLPFPLLATTGREGAGSVGRTKALGGGLATSAIILAALGVAALALGWLLLRLAAGAGISADARIIPYVAFICMSPFLLLAILLPRIRKLPPTAPARRSAAIGPYVDFFWRYGFLALALVAFVSIYRIGDVLALNLSKPMIKDLGYSLTEIGRADSFVALGASIIGVGIGGWMAAKWRQGAALAAGALFAAIGNFGFVWLAHQPPSELALYAATAADQFGNSLAGTVFVVYLSLLVNPRYAGAQYAFLTGLAFMLARMLSGAGGAMVEQFDAAGLPGWDMFFLISGIASLAALVLLPWVSRPKPRAPDDLEYQA